MKILLLEDIPESAAATIVALGVLGDITVEHRSSLDEAIGYLVTSNADVVVVDHNTLAGAGLRPLRAWTSAPIVAFTGHELDAETVLEAKYDGAAHKPWADDLVAEIRRVLG